MTAPLRLSNRYLWIGLIFLVLLAFLSFLAAPASNRLTSGSSWNQGPDGYSAWYDYMAQQGTPLQRWQRPVEDLIKQLAETSAPDAPATLVQVNSGFIQPGALYPLRPWLSDWAEAGHHVIILGQQEPATAAPFATQQASPAGLITVETRRRASLSEARQPLLADDYGAIAWQRPEGNGLVTVIVTPHLAANAYQADPGNFPFLADVVTQAGGPIWVDEYLHGYKEADVVVEEAGDSWISYLAQTPLVVIVTQLVLVGLVALVAQNRRFGVKQRLKRPVVDNSEAYIAALAGALHKAGSHDFVTTTLSKAERLTLQKTLGLGEGPVPDAALQTAWTQSTGEAAQELTSLVEPPTRLQRDQELAAWLQRLQTLHQSILKRNPAP
ncbi:DUF4350 domain-containing protein [Pseudanabaena sp. FACHB-2040]|uniref:DUF4350 domain-containing protein n=1 Tax=Pseudanabaena sp. FACHB-2040 TaxID=2692859 RepID=UPI001688FEB5|nr:DUF4350 domain-containing protein [Pseudanabaena sp. FACHB-2040]MBD2260359.1 DUF4350 domain-containing protein [Pseudanabaena sp. FACHB-2040]